MTTAHRGPRRPPTRRGAATATGPAAREARAGFLFALPFLALFAVFTAGPVLASLRR